jgi:hypothetical protein
MTSTIQTSKSWLATIAIDLVLVASAYYWQIEKVDGAGNLFMFLVWLAIVSRTLIGLTWDRTHFEQNPLPPGLRTHGVLARLAIVVFLVWIGYFWSAGFSVLSSLMVFSARTKEPKEPSK